MGRIIHREVRHKSAYGCFHLRAASNSEHDVWFRSVGRSVKCWKFLLNQPDVGRTPYAQWCVLNRTLPNGTNRRTHNDTQTVLRTTSAANTHMQPPCICGIVVTAIERIHRRHAYTETHTRYSYTQRSGTGREEERMKIAFECRIK